MNNITINGNFEKYKNLFLEQNAKINLISKNEEQYLYEKHYYDSIGIKLFFDKYNYIPSKVLDIGTGGGFPAIPLAMEFPNMDITAIDSRGKKIIAISKIANKLNLQNIKFINERVENLKDKKYDLVLSRAVGKINKLIEYAYPLVETDGYIVLYKSKDVNKEIDDAKNTIRKYKLKIKPLIEYKLPLKEDYTRVLVILQK